ncbi:MAG TPA: A/G-specific adenine glycosylase, partial [Candidatus Marinimicrobia bacterium]|nr:A/G-specific adenine glycosylase [Candidatus Neomarinimicrobiota bacterium]
LLAFSEVVEKGTALFEEKLDKWLNQDRPGDFNQAMMELGSQICRRNEPRCFECSVGSFCKAKAEGNPAVYPNIPKKKERPHKTIVAGIIWNDGKFLIQKRPDAGLLGGLWEFPGGKVENGEALDNTRPGDPRGNRVNC